MIKNKFISSSLLATSLVVSGLYSSTVLAQSTPIVCAGYERPKTQLLGPKTGKKLQEAFEAYNTEQINEAIRLLREIEPEEAFDKASVGRFLGQILASEEGKGAEAIKVLESAVEVKILNDPDHVDTLMLLGDLSSNAENYKAAEKWYKAWMSITCKEDPKVYVKLGNAYALQKEYAKVIEPADKAIALNGDEQDNKPYILKLSSYYELKEYKKALGVAEELVQIFPEDKGYWNQLGDFYMLNEDYKKALSAMELTYKQGYMEKEGKFRTLAQLYTSNGMPYKAAQILKKHIDSGDVKRDEQALTSMANSLHRAMEFKDAAKVYGELATMKSDPEYYRKQGVLLTTAENYKEAVVALNKALELNVEDTGKVHFTLMEANFYTGNYKSAMNHLIEAKKDASVRRNAIAWESYIKEKAKNKGITL